MQRIVESSRDDCLRLARERGEADELPTAEREQTSPGVEAELCRGILAAPLPGTMRILHLS